MVAFGLFIILTALMMAVVAARGSSAHTFSAPMSTPSSWSRPSSVSSKNTSTSFDRSRFSYRSTRRRLRRAPATDPA